VQHDSQNRLNYFHHQLDRSRDPPHYPDHYKHIGKTTTMLQVPPYGQLILEDGNLVAVRMPETCDPTPVGGYSAPGQEVIVIKPEYPNPESLMRLITGHDPNVSTEHWTNVFQIRPGGWQAMDPIPDNLQFDNKIVLFRIPASSFK